ncbi:MAG: CCA tRNA nucleotidyltransferase [Candidatus Riflebacteria bacterium]|nr:CCA tRNA nucleotidyltransferase [Candidatus Riflebacteria bacterium]
MALDSKIQGLYSNRLLELLTQIGQIAEELGLKAYVVGGFVRDLLLGKANFDIDIMVEGDAIPFATKVGQELNAECKLIERFHTAHIFLDNLTLDFSSARKEYYPHPGDLPEVSFSNIRDDLYRRDFTINALALSINSNQKFELIDLFNGELDLKEGIIKVLHSKSFLDDPTRLYRALRFADRFKFVLDSNTEYLFDKAIKLSYPSSLSTKRIAAEIEKCFKEKYPLSLLNRYRATGLLAYYHKSFKGVTRPDFSFSMVRSMTTRLRSKFPNIIESAVYWSLFLSSIPFTESQPLLNNSGLPHSVGLQTVNTLSSWQVILTKLSLANTRLEIYNILKDTCPETLALLYLKNKNKEIENKLNLYVNELYSIKPSITGKDLIEAGIEPGPQIRQILDKIIEKKLENPELNRKEELDLVGISNI